MDAEKMQAWNKIVACHKKFTFSCPSRAKVKLNITTIGVKPLQIALSQRLIYSKILLIYIYNTSYGNK